MKSFLKFFTSIRLAIVLLIIIILASILGTLIPQQRSQEEYLVHYGKLANLFMRLQLTKLYHSAWYIALLFFFAINITICNIERLGPKLRRAFRPRLVAEPKNILSFKIKEKIKKHSSLSMTWEILRKELRRRRYQLMEEEKDKRVYILARKRTLGLFGSDIVHFGILIILAGGIVSGFAGFKSNLILAEGQTAAVLQSHFRIRLDKFETEYYPNGSVKDWKSTLTVVENGASKLTKVVEVNHPLSYRGIVFYQSSYGWDWDDPSLELWAKKKDDPSFLKKFSLKVNEKIPLEENSQILVRQFIPDFVIDEKGQVTSRSSQPNNPAAFIEVWTGEEKTISGWIFANFPDFARLHQSKESNLSFELKSYAARQYSVIQASRDPGVSLIWLGSALLMAGLFTAFFWPTKEIKFILEEAGNTSEIFAAGVVTKNKEAFCLEFQDIINSLRKEK